MNLNLVRLSGMLDEANIPYEWDSIYDEHDQIIYPNRRELVSDVICHKYSYGHSCGLLEQMGLIPEERMNEIGDSVEGYLEPETVFERWRNHYYENK